MIKLDITVIDLDISSMAEKRHYVGKAVLLDGFDETKAMTYFHKIADNLSNKINDIKNDLKIRCRIDDDGKYYYATYMLPGYRPIGNVGFFHVFSRLIKMVVEEYKKRERQ